MFIDDATSTLTQPLFVASESAFACFEALERYLTTHGRPMAFHSDKHSVFRVAKQDAASGHGMTQFAGRALEQQLETEVRTTRMLLAELGPLTLNPAPPGALARRRSLVISLATRSTRAAGQTGSQRGRLPTRG